MNNFFKTTLRENDELKLIKSLKETYQIISMYLKKDYDINDLAIYIENAEESRILHKNKNENNLFLYEVLSFSQNYDSKIIFKIFSENEEQNNEIKEIIPQLELKLQIFSQTIYSKFLEKSLNDLTLIDNVTGLFNRHYLDNYAENILSLSQRENKKIAFLKIGIDQFKAVIDEFDYLVGDMVLKGLADSLKESLRTSDIVIKIDGDEFLVILMNIINEENATMISEKLINNFKKQKVIVNKETNQTLMKTICSGISIFPDDSTSMDEIIKQSDVALYEARNKGRSQTFKYTKEETNTIDFF
jgi:diguanylate cyclase (GGDEF)-like protein